MALWSRSPPDAAEAGRRRSRSMVTLRPLHGRGGRDARRRRRRRLPGTSPAPCGQRGTVVIIRARRAPRGLAHVAARSVSSRSRVRPDAHVGAPVSRQTAAVGSAVGSEVGLGRPGVGDSGRRLGLAARRRLGRGLRGGLVGGRLRSGLRRGSLAGSSWARSRLGRGLAGRAQPSARFSSVGRGVGAVQRLGGRRRA